MRWICRHVEELPALALVGRAPAFGADGRAGVPWSLTIGSVYFSTLRQPHPALVDSALHAAHPRVVSAALGTLGPVVRKEEHRRPFGDAERLELLQQPPDIFIDVFDETADRGGGGIQAAWRRSVEGRDLLAVVRGMLATGMAGCFRHSLRIVHSVREQSGLVRGSRFRRKPKRCRRFALPPQSKERPPCCLGGHPG